MQDSNLRPSILEGTRSHATGAVTNYDLRGFICQGWWFPIPPCDIGRKYPEPSPPEILWPQGKIARGLTLNSLARSQRAGSNRLLPEVSARCATGAVSRHGGTIAMRSGRVKTKEPHPSPPVAVNGNLFLDSCWIRQRVDAVTNGRRQREIQSIRARYLAPSASGDRIGFWWS